MGMMAMAIEAASWIMVRIQGNGVVKLSFILGRALSEVMGSL